MRQPGSTAAATSQGERATLRAWGWGIGLRATKVRHLNNSTSIEGCHKALKCILYALVNATTGGQEPFWKTNSSVCDWRKHFCLLGEVMGEAGTSPLSHSYLSFIIVELLKQLLCLKAQYMSINFLSILQ